MREREGGRERERVTNREREREGPPYFGRQFLSLRGYASHLQILNTSFRCVCVSLSLSLYHQLLSLRGYASHLQYAVRPSGVCVSLSLPVPFTPSSSMPHVSPAIFNTLKGEYPLRGNINFVLFESTRHI